MASWSDFEGKTVDAALKKASEELKVPVDKINYEIVFAGSSGIFGLVGVKNARIRVSGGLQGQAAADRDEIQSLVDETFAGEKADTASDRVKPAAAGRSHRQKARKKPPEKPPEKPSEKPPALDEAAIQVGRETLQKMVDAITDEAQVSCRPQQKEVLFNISGGSPGVLIGKHGQTLKSMQHIVEKVMQASQGEKVRVLVDVESYLEKRRESLKAMAVKLAEKARQTGKPAIINRMDAFERKIIHDALKKDKNVNTKSTGNGDVRSVIIHPGKKKTSNKRAPGK